MDNNITTALMIGILGSLVATAMFIFLSKVFENIFLPWYADKIYSGIRIDGHWESKEFKCKDKMVPINDSPLMTLNLRQKGEKINGVFTLKCKENMEEYILEGRIKDMYFLATAVPKSKRSTDGISLLVHVSNEESNLVMIGATIAQTKFGKVTVFEELKFIWKH